LRRFENDPIAASQVTGPYAGPSSDLPELAAWTMVANVVMNLDEAITKE